MAMAVIRVAVMAGSSRDLGRHPIQIGGSWFVEIAQEPSSGTEPDDGFDEVAGRPRRVAPFDPSLAVHPKLQPLKT